MAGGSGGSGGNAARKRREATETPQQRIARCEKRNKMNRTILSVQEATQRLNRVIYGSDAAEESALVQEKVELELFFGALIKAGGVLGQQGKLLAVQSQWSKVGAADIRIETDNDSMRKFHKDFVRECAVSLCFSLSSSSLCFSLSSSFSLVSVTHQDAHQISLAWMRFREAPRGSRRHPNV